MCQSCYKKWIRDNRKTSNYVTAFFGRGQAWLSGDTLPTAYVVNGGGAFALDAEVWIGGTRFWIGAAHSAPTVGPDGQPGQYFRLYPQVE